MNLRSIGVRLTLWYTAAFAVGFATLGAAMWFGVQQSLYHAIDDTLLDRIVGIERFIEDHKTRLDVDEVKEEFRAHGDFFQVSDEQGRWLHRGLTLEDATLPLGVPGAGDRFENVLSNGEPLRFLSRTVDIDGRALTIQVAAPLHDLQEGLRQSAWALLPLFPLMLMAAAAGGYWLARRALAPVDEITRTARAFSADDLSARLAVPPTGDELERLSATLNEMLGRLEAAFRRIARFTADASHELRTPLAVMRTTAEVALRAPEHDSEPRTALEQILAEVERTTHLTENLLLLARADSGAAPLQRQPVDLTAAVGEACTQASVLARVKGLTLATQLPEDTRLWVSGDAQALRRLFLILLDNAVKYTPAGGRIEVSLHDHGESALGVVRDSGIGIPPHDLPHVFDRFYRADRARSREQGGTGLGLAIGRWIATVHGGDIAVTSEVERGSVFTVRLPRG